jgi:hypothetical protein
VWTSVSFIIICSYVLQEFHKSNYQSNSVSSHPYVWQYGSSSCHIFLTTRRHGITSQKTVSIWNFTIKILQLPTTSCSSSLNIAFITVPKLPQPRSMLSSRARHRISQQCNKRNVVIRLAHSLIELRPSWEADNCAATQELPRMLWNPKVHCPVQKSPLLVPIFSQINPIHTIPSYLSKWVRCHHGVTRPQVADGGDALPLWRISANILNKQSRTAEKGWASSLGLGRGDNNYSS